MSDDRAYERAYILARDNDPTASHAVLSDAARSRMRWPAYAGLGGARLEKRLQDDLDSKRNHHVQRRQEEIRVANLASGAVATMAEQRAQAVADTARARPWLFPTVRAPEAAARAKGGGPRASSRSRTSKMTTREKRRIVAAGFRFILAEHCASLGVYGAREVEAVRAQMSAEESADIIESALRRARDPHELKKMRTRMGIVPGKSAKRAKEQGRAQ